MKKIVFAFVLIVIAGALGLFVSLSNDDIEDIIVCATDNNTHYIPKDLCDYYLYNFRGDQKDIEYLQGREGLAFAFAIPEHATRQRLIKFLISRGIDVNSISKIDGLTPLHAAILLNEPSIVQALIENGADPGKKAANGLDARSFLKLLQEKAPASDRSGIEKLLKK